MNTVNKNFEEISMNNSHALVNTRSNTKANVNANANKHANTNRSPKRTVNGILLLDKPTGVTSNAALQTVKRLFKARKAGHSGSLDPIASGLLPICFGEATKLSQFLLEAEKHYTLSVQLGIRTDSGDNEGKVIATREVPSFSKESLESIFDRFRGQISQIPSMFSAIKHKGQPLYKLARQGIEVERESRSLTIYSLELLSFTKDTFSLEVKASKGTYIRTLVDDIGEALGCGAHVTALRRLGAGPYTAAQMVELEQLQEVAETGGMDELDQYLLPCDTSVARWPDVKLTPAAAYYLKQGQPVIVPYAPTEGWVRLLLKDNQFLGVGEILEDGRVAPRRLMQGVI